MAAMLGCCGALGRAEQLGGAGAASSQAGSLLLPGGGLLLLPAAEAEAPVKKRVIEPCSSVSGAATKSDTWRMHAMHRSEG